MVPKWMKKEKNCWGEGRQELSTTALSLAIMENWETLQRNREKRGRKVSLQLTEDWMINLECNHIGDPEREHFFVSLRSCDLLFVVV